MCFLRKNMIHVHDTRFVWVGSAVHWNQNLRYCLHYRVVDWHRITILFLTWAQMSVPTHNLLHLQMVSWIPSIKRHDAVQSKVHALWCSLFQPFKITHFNSSFGLLCMVLLKWSETTWLVNLFLPLSYCCANHCDLCQALACIIWGWPHLCFVDQDPPLTI